MNSAERTAWRYLARIALLWLFGLGAVGSVWGVVVTGDLEMAMTLPLSLFVFAVLWRVGPKSADFLSDEDRRGLGVDGDEQRD